MANRKVGIWLIGAWGGVSTTLAVGLTALKDGLIGTTGLVTALPQFARLGLADWNQFVIGGHEIRRTSYAVEARNLHRNSRVFSAELLERLEPLLAELDANVRTGTLLNVGPTIESLASSETRKMRGELPTASIERIRTDLQQFQDRHKLDHLIVVNLASTEAPTDAKAAELTWADLSKTLESTAATIPASTVYAIAAMQAGCSYINFTPSTGSDLQSLLEFAVQQRVLHVGRDGKTGETLLKSVLAPMFRDRNLSVKSWVGHNIFGNMDGKVLDDPANKESKVRSKDHLLTDILGYQPQTLVSIEYIESMGDWKTAWDHIHFEGFLGTRMTMQFTWQGCDSMLAAPLVLDLIRLTEREQRRGNFGVMQHLCSFFKSPMGDGPADFAAQYRLLEQWADDVAQEA